MKNHVPCAFVNDENPVGYGAILGYKVSSNDDPRNEELTLSVIRDVHYRHPDAPDDAILVTPVSKTIARAKTGDSKFPLLKMLHLNQTACKELIDVNW